MKKKEKKSKATHKNIVIYYLFKTLLNKKQHAHDEHVPFSDSEAAQDGQYVVWAAKDRQF